MRFSDWVARVKNRVPECCTTRNGEIDFDHILLVALEEMGKHVTGGGEVRDSSQRRKR